MPAWLAAGSLATCAYAWLAVCSRAPGGATLEELWLASAVAGAAMLGLWGFAERFDREPPLLAVLGFSALFHLLGVVGLPILEDDVYRYLWDGKIFADTGDPYGLPPEDAFERRDLSPRFEEILGSVNHPHLPTIYGPTLQWLFRACHALAPGAVGPLQAAGAASSLAIVALLARVARPRHLLLFAWSPLVVKEFAFTAHTDALAIALLLGGWLAVARERPRLGGALLALAVGAKLFALLLVPLVLRRALAPWLVFATTLAVLYLPFADLAGGHAAGLGTPLLAMGTDWVFNAPLYPMLRAALPDLAARGLLLAGFAVVWLVAARRSLTRPDAELPRGDWIYGALLVAVPVLNPWYVAWPLAFAVVRPSAWAVTASLCVLLSYAIGLNLPDAGLGAYAHPQGLRLLEFAPVALALAWDAWRARATQAAP